MCKCYILIQVIKINGGTQYFQPDYLISQINTSLPQISSRLWSWFLIIAVEVSSLMFALGSFMRPLAVSNCTNPAGCPHDPRKEITMRPSWPFIVCFAQMCKLDSVSMCVCEQQKATERERKRKRSVCQLMESVIILCRHLVPQVFYLHMGNSLEIYRLSSGKSTTTTKGRQQTQQ